MNRIINGDCLEVVKELEDESIDCVVTSPPYWGLRDYGTASWIGGDPGCPHMRTTKISKDTATGHKGMFEQGNVVGDAIYKSECPKCGAIREDNQLGLEETPEEYTANLVKLFSEIRRVLKKEGTVWLNLGDSYTGTGSKGDLKDPKHPKGRNGQSVAVNNKIKGLKPKDLVGIPWRVAFALQADGWYLRQDIIWSKPNPMPESVTDRCTKSHEYIFLLTKSQHYYFNADAIKEKTTDTTVQRLSQQVESQNGSLRVPFKTNGVMKAVGDTERRNKRDVWSVSTQPYAEAHFAVYPQKLIEPCVLAGCPEGGVVLDPFFGSGTTGFVAKKLNRQYIGIELNPEYIKIADKRLAQEQLL